MSYMEKKTHKRQTTIITLSDQNTKEIQDIRDQKEKMLAAYEEKKAKLRAIMLDKEAALAKTKQELDDLAEYKVHKKIFVLYHLNEMHVVCCRRYHRQEVVCTTFIKLQLRITSIFLSIEQI